LHDATHVKKQTQMEYILTDKYCTIDVSRRMLVTYSTIARAQRTGYK